MVGVTLAPCEGDTGALKAPPVVPRKAAIASNFGGSDIKGGLDSPGESAVRAEALGVATTGESWRGVPIEISDARKSNSSPPAANEGRFWSAGISFDTAGDGAAGSIVRSSAPDVSIGECAISGRTIEVLRIFLR